MTENITGLICPNDQDWTWFALYRETFLRIDANIGLPKNRCVLMVYNDVLKWLDGQAGGDQSGVRRLSIVFGGGEMTTTNSNLGKINYSHGSGDGGTLKFYSDASCTKGLITGTAISGLDDDRAVYIKAVPDGIHKYPAVSDITIEKTTSTMNSRTRRGGGVGLGETIAVSTTSTVGVYTFTMPEDANVNVSVTAAFPEKDYVTGLDYIGFEGKADNTGTEMKVYVLDGSETKLGISGQTTWYVCNSTTGLSYTSSLSLSGTVNLILADGCKMTIGSADSPINGNAIYHGSGAFTIFGQTDGSGTLAVYGTQSGIYCNGSDLTFNGGTVDVNASGTDITSNSTTVTINDGKVSIVGGTNSGIYSNNNPISITGGKVSVIGGTYGIVNGTNSITLGWRHHDDYIYASGYTCTNDNLRTAAGKRFVAYNLLKDQGDEGFDPAKTDITASTVLGTVNGPAIVTPSNYQTNPVNKQTIVKKTLRPLVYKELDGQVVTDFSPGYLLSIDRDDIKPASKATPDFTIGTKPYYIFKASTEQNPFTVTVSYSGTDFVTLGGLPEGPTFNDVEDQPMQRSFAMPAGDVALTTAAVTGLTASGTYTYTGSPQTPAINLGESAFEATNYTVTGITSKEGTNSQLTDGSAVDAGEYSIAITGLGQYIGTASVDFTIGKVDYDGTTTASAEVFCNQVTTDATLALPALPDGASYAATGTVGGRHTCAD